MIKVVAPTVACTVVDRAIQIHGGMGVSQDSFLAYGRFIRLVGREQKFAFCSSFGHVVADVPLLLAYAMLRTLRIADGPDEVHKVTIAKLELQQQLKKRRETVQAKISDGRTSNL